MIDFCITNNRDLCSCDFENKIPLKNNFTLQHDNSVQVKEINDKLILFCGILWEGRIEDFLQSHRQNGDFYCVIFDKRTHVVEVISDFLENFPIYYYKDKDDIVITNCISGFSRKVKPNADWIKLANKKIYVDRLIQPCAGITTKSYLNQNITVLENVHRLGPGSVISLDLATSDMNIFRWYDAIQEYVRPCFREPKYNIDTATELVDKILRQNCQTIKENFGSLVQFCSTGIDSLTVLKYMDGVPKYGYYGAMYHNESPDKIKKLYADTGGQLHCLGEDEYKTAYTQSVKGLRTPTSVVDLAVERHVIDTFDLEDKVIVKGTFGDEIFWHDPWSAMSWCVHNLGLADMDAVRNVLENHYAYQPFHMTEDSLTAIRASENFEYSVLNHHYNRQISYLKDDRVLCKQMVLSPYVDMRLRNLMPQCDNDARTKSILDAQIQRNLIPGLEKYVNTNKSGGEESFPTIGYHQQQIIQLGEFLKSRG